MSMIIDFVLPWVDNQDLEWQKSRQQYAENQSLSDANSSARFRDSGTLKYVLRSIEKNCPWYNKIYLVTCGHHPEWLDINLSTLYRKISRNGDFSRAEIKILTKRLNLDEQERDSIFFGI